MSQRGSGTGENERVAVWAVAAIVGGAILGVLSGGVFADSGRPNVNGWASWGAIVGFVIMLSFVAWRIVVGGSGGLVLGAILGAIVGSLATPNDSGAPVDWGFVIGVIVGAVAGIVTGLVVGTVWHVRHKRARRIARPTSR